MNGAIRTTALLKTPAQELAFVEALRNRYDEIVPWNCWTLTRDLKLVELGLAS